MARSRAMQTQLHMGGDLTISAASMDTTSRRIILVIVPRWSIYRSARLDYRPKELHDLQCWPLSSPSDKSQEIKIRRKSSGSQTRSASRKIKSVVGSERPSNKSRSSKSRSFHYASTSSTKARSACTSLTSLEAS